MRDRWTHGYSTIRYEHALSAAFEEPWPLSAEAKSSMDLDRQDPMASSTRY